MRREPINVTIPAPSPPTLGAKRLHPKAKLPTRESARATGWDLTARLDKPISLAPFQQLVVPTGIALSIPPGYDVEIRSRSGLAANDRVAVLNSPGTVDEDYTGEIKVILMNFGPAHFRVIPEMRIAQMVLRKREEFTMEEIETLPETSRGAGGFGSTGVE